MSFLFEIPDAIIAAMSIFYDLPLYAYNKKFKYIPGVKLY